MPLPPPTNPGNMIGLSRTHGNRIMAQWSEGYVTEVEYIADCFPELAPAHLNAALLHRGIAFPETHERFNYLELGFGQGVTLAMLAATQPQGCFFGNDFNPSHVLGARALAESAQLDNLTLFEDSFAELAARDLPPMDYIVLHGIYSWVSAENRGHIVALIRKLLKTGASFTFPTTPSPDGRRRRLMQRAMLEFAARHGAETLAERFGAAREFLQSLARSGAAYFAHNPVAQEQLDGLWDLNDAYLVHEFASRTGSHCTTSTSFVTWRRRSSASPACRRSPTTFHCSRSPGCRHALTSRPRIRRCAR